MAHESLEDALATLIATTRRSKRQASLTQVTDALNIALSHLGSIEKIAERISLSARMLEQFAAVEDLDPAVRRMFSDRRIDSVDAAVYLSYFKPSYQVLLARKLAKHQIDTKDLRAAWEYLKREPKTSPKKLINLIQKSKIKKVYACEFVLRGSLTPKTVERRISKALGADTVEKVVFDAPFGKVLFNKRGKDALSKYCKLNGIGFSKAIVDLIYGDNA